MVRGGESGYRAAIVGTGRMGSTFDDDVGAPQRLSAYHGVDRHNGLYTVPPISHAAAYRATAGYQLVAAANRGVARLRAFGARWGVHALYTDYREMLRQERPDVVSVCTQSPEKAEVVVAAAEAGVRAIIVEKALATSLAEADGMIAACERRGVLLAVNHPFRFSQPTRRTKELIAEGAIGALRVVIAFGVSGMLHQGSHSFDLLRYWAGDVDEVLARVRDYAPESDLPATALLRFTGGVSGLVDNCHGVPPAFEARGTGGYLTTSTLVGDGWLNQIVPRESTASRSYPGRLVVQPIDTALHRSPSSLMLSDLFASLENGAPFPSTGYDGRAALEIGIACFASHLAGGPVRLPLADRSLRIPNR